VGVLEIDKTWKGVVIMQQVRGEFTFDIKHNDSLCIFLKDNNSDMQFAASELKKYLQFAYNTEIHITGHLQCDQYKGVVVLSICSGDTGDEENDEFSITVEEGNLLISGSNKRSLLYGVYKFLDQYIGYKWVNPEYQYNPVEAHEIINICSKNYKPDFPKRGLVLENSESLEYIVRIIDWMAKNNYNSIFFTYHLWERYKQVLRGEIEKRGLMLTLGGHNIDLFLPAGRYFSGNPEWFSLYNGERMDTQPCFSSEAGTDTIIGNILEYCKSEVVIDTICIWPNDNLYTCKCGQCAKSGFINTYIKFLDKLKKRAAKAGMKISIQHIAYNAQLEWDMLDTIPENNDLDTLLACWGRDYTYDLAHPSNEYDIRFKNVVQNWTSACNNSFGTRLSMFEYYGDYWMLTALFPPLTNTILKDVDFFKKTGVYEITCLIVPFYLPEKIIHEELLHEELPENSAGYEFNSERTVLWFNLYVLARKMWDCSASHSDIMESYCAACFGPESAKAAKLIEILEESLSRISSFNMRFFSLNFKSVWLRDNWLETKTVSKRASSEIIKWNPEKDNIKVPEERIAACLDILEIMKPYLEDALNLKAMANNPYIDNFNNLKAFFGYIYKKIKSVYHQSEAQNNIMHDDYYKAAQELMAAIELETQIKGWDRLSCEEWLEKIGNTEFDKEGGSDR